MSNINDIPCPGIDSAPRQSIVGRPRNSIDWEAVAKYAKKGLSIEDIAVLARVDDKTVMASPEFRSIVAQKRSELRHDLLEQIHSSKWGPMLIFRAKNQLGWTDNMAVTGAGGGPLKFDVLFDLPVPVLSAAIEGEARELPRGMPETDAIQE